MCRTLSERGQIEDRYYQSLSKHEGRQKCTWKLQFIEYLFIPFPCYTCIVCMHDAADAQCLVPSSSGES